MAILWAQAASSADAGLLPILVAVAGLFLLALGFISLLLVSQRRIMRAARAREQAQRNLLEAAAVGRLLLWTADPVSGTFTTGGSAETLFGCSPGTLEDLLGLVLPEDVPRARALLQKARPEDSAILGVRMRHRDGPVLETRWQVRRREGRLEGVLRDNTRESQLQAQLIQSQKLEAVGTLVSGVSHEFGNLLASIEACVDLLATSPALRGGEAEAAHHIQDAALRGRELIRRLMVFTRRGLGEIRLEPPGPMLLELQRLLAPLLGRRVHLEVEAEEGLPPHPMNRTQILQGLLNLCLNAKDAMPQGGSVWLRARRGHEPPGSLVLEVADQGPGVPPELRQRIFEPFFTTKEPGKGTGLGLAMTQRIVIAHGGSLTCESGPEGGALFRLVLPAEVIPPEDPGQDLLPSTPSP
ncbi:MAG: hypothetical protein HY823_04215 [Acidobacteria bacterium]|nr:hypothetical protein [Acidobacteriota bacterium]